MALWEVFEARANVHLPAPIAEELEVASWSEMLPGRLMLPSPEEENLGDWLDAYEGWVRGTIAALMAVQSAARTALIAGERLVAESYRSGTPVEPAPAPAQTPGRYKVVLPDGGRKRQTKLGLWDRFQTAEGVFGSVLRFSVAAGMLYFLATVGS